MFVLVSRPRVEWTAVWEIMLFVVLVLCRHGVKTRERRWCR